MQVGVLALQGDFEAHAKRLRELVGEVRLVRKASQLEGLDLLVMPGGESTAMLKLMDDQLKEQLCQRVRSKTLSIFATCAGVILLAKEVSDPKQESLGLLDVSVSRNAYGRQVDSFVSELEWTDSGKQMLSTNAIAADGGKIEGVFIRAPKFTRLGAGVSALLRHGDTPVLVQQGNVIAATFHPELSPQNGALYNMVLHRSTVRPHSQALN